MNPLFAVPVHVKGLEGSELPPDAAGAYLICYSAAPDSKLALQQAKEALAEDHLQFLEMNGEVEELDPTFWTEHVEAAWPDEEEDLPTEEEIQELQTEGGVLYSPFCCYSDEG